MLLGVRLLAGACLAAGVAGASPPRLAEVPPSEPPPSERLLLRIPPAPPLPEGTIRLSEHVHLVPIHLFPVKAGLHDTFAVVVDGDHGLPSLRLQVAGADILGGVEGEIELPRGHRLHGTYIRTPNLLLVAAEDTMVIYRRGLRGNRQLSAGLRTGFQLWNTPNLLLAQAYAQAGARLDGLLEGRRLVHLDAYAGSGAVMTFGPSADAYRLVPGLEVSAALVIEK